MSKQTALHCAVGLLARREHGEQELRKKLALKEFEQEEIELAIERLLEKDYLSDERFAQSMCRYRANRGFGWLHIANELKQKGVCSTIIQKLQKNCEIDWYVQAELAYNKRFPSFEPVMALKEAKSYEEKALLNKEQNKIKAKQIRFLQYRGFTLEETLHAIECARFQV
ncbi:MAG: regulatory protein RecX [Colwellia sp.]